MWEPSFFLVCVLVCQAIHASFTPLSLCCESFSGKKIHSKLAHDQTIGLGRLANIFPHFYTCFSGKPSLLRAWESTSTYPKNILPCEIWYIRSGLLFLAYHHFDKRFEKFLSFDPFLQLRTYSRCNIFFFESIEFYLICFSDNSKYLRTYWLWWLRWLWRLWWLTNLKVF